MLLSLLCTTLLTACGGEGGVGYTSSSTTPAGALASQLAATSTLVTDGNTPQTPLAKSRVLQLAAVYSMSQPISADLPSQPGLASPSAAALPAASLPVVAPAVANGSSRSITDIKFESIGQAAQGNMPVTFGHVFAVGDVLPTDSLIGKLDSGATVPLQMDVKATHADKSVRHAVISAVLPNLAAGQVLSMNLVKASPQAQAQPVATPADLVASGFTTTVSLKVNGKLYTASADNLLKTAKATSWLSGQVANEWKVSAPLQSSDGIVHPHLTARFDIRSYAGMKKAKVDVVVENNWAYEAAPSNIVYDAAIDVGGKNVYTKAGLNHYHHARWKKTFWWGDAPQVNIQHNTAYLIGTRAVPNYDQSAVPSPALLSSIAKSFSGAVTEPMQNGLAAPYMPQTGGRHDLGLLPGWAVAYLLTMDKDAKNAMMGTADLAGSWSSHFRDKKTDRVVSLVDYPYMTLLGRSGDTFNPVTKKNESFPDCGGTCTTPLTADSSHQPNFAYLPYIVSGDHYYLEELQFWAMFNMLQHNPGYRDNIKGLLRPDQTRGQAWSLRSLAEAAYISPDSDVLRPQFETFLSNNLDWYNANYVNNSNPDNALGALIDSNALVYDGGTGIAPWQDDFFTAAVGHSAELGFAKAKPLVMWKSKFPVSRMIASGYCWIDASIYKMVVRPTASSSNFTSMGRVYQASQTAAVSSLACGSDAMASALGLKTGEMVGYANVIDGYPAYMQPALAYSVDAGNTEAANAWALFMKRPIKANYANGAQFAIVPRS